MPPASMRKGILCLKETDRRSVPEFRVRKGAVEDCKMSIAVEHI
jgi:hypothetical protein